MKRQEATDVFEFSKLLTLREMALPVWNELLGYGIRPPEPFCSGYIEDALEVENGIVHKEFDVLKAMKAIEPVELRIHRPGLTLGKPPDWYKRINPDFWRMAKHCVDFAFDNY